MYKDVQKVSVFNCEQLHKWCCSFQILFRISKIPKPLGFIILYSDVPKVLKLFHHYTQIPPFEPYRKQSLHICTTYRNTWSFGSYQNTIQNFFFTWWNFYDQSKNINIMYLTRYLMTFGTLTPNPYTYPYPTPSLLKH